MVCVCVCVWQVYKSRKLATGLLVGAGYSIIRVLGVKLRSSVLVAGTFIQ